MAQKVQSLIFQTAESPADVNDGNGWTESTAKAWADDHDFRSDKTDASEDSIRLRQFDPDECEADSFMTLSENFPVGVQAAACETDVEVSSFKPRDGLLEHRTYATTFELETRQDGEDDELPTIKGHAAIFNKWSENLGGFREKIAAGAFKGVMKDDVRALFNHNDDLILGRTTAGTLKLGTDKRGLRFENTPPDTSYARDLVVSMRRGDVTQASFGFIVAKDGDTWRENKDGVIERTIERVERLFDVSPVTFPAYPDTAVAARGLKDFLSAKDEDSKQHAEVRFARIKRLTTITERAARSHLSNGR